MLHVTLLVILLWMSLPVSAQEKQDPLEYYPALMDTLIRADYEAADAICNQMEQEHPAAIYGRACIIYGRITDFEDTTGRAQFFQLCDSCIDVCAEMKQANNADLAMLAYLRGSALAAKALILNREGSTIKALRLLMSARGEFQEAIEADPTFYDAYLGRGAYRYGAAMNASLLTWLPFIPSAASGWQDLWLAVDSSRFSTYYALSALVWFVIDKQDFALADSICQAGLVRFPDCRSFLWPRLSLQMKQKQWNAATESARELLVQYSAQPTNNGYDVTGLYATLMTCADSLGKPAAAVDYARQGLAAYRSPYAEGRRKAKLKVLRERIEQAEATHRGH